MVISACITQPSVLVCRAVFPHTSELETILGKISRVFWGYFLGVLNWFDYLFLSFCKSLSL
jgi:hypothetical protein